ncbi:MAG: FecCD family ABC transporter permease [Thermoplasmatota archaeon]
MRKFSVFALFLLLLLASLVLGVSVGSVDVPFPDTIRVLLSAIPGLEWAADGIWSPYRTIIIDIRLPVVLMALFVGTGLSVSGASLQGLFRNPLVDPFIIGISAGGALGYVAGTLLTRDASVFVSQGVRLVLSFLFAVSTVFLAYMVSRRGSRVPLTHLLLAGIAISASVTAGTQLLVYLFVENPSKLIFSLMGSCSNSRWWELGIVSPIVVFGSAGLFLYSRDLNAFSAGEDTAKHLGVETERTKAVVLVLASLIAAVTVPFCGMIGFVGLMVPHMVRRIIGPDQRLLLPASALFGGAFLILCDLASRSLMDSVIPLGIVTGFLGGGFFIYLLRAGRSGL